MQQTKVSKKFFYLNELFGNFTKSRKKMFSVRMLAFIFGITMGCHAFANSVYLGGTLYVDAQPGHTCNGGPCSVETVTISNLQVTELTPGGFMSIKGTLSSRSYASMEIGMQCSGLGQHIDGKPTAPSSNVRCGFVGMGLNIPTILDQIGDFYVGVTFSGIRQDKTIQAQSNGTHPVSLNIMY